LHGICLRCQQINEVLDKAVTEGQCAVFGEGNLVKIYSKLGSRLLFVSNEPLKEPVAWRGPIVMNTQEELDQAFEELDMGTFIKSTKPVELF
jgi:redox-sensitive bicupin YhaK (pirin superfamily)